MLNSTIKIYILKPLSEKDFPGRFSFLCDVNNILKRTIKHWSIKKKFYLKYLWYPVLINWMLVVIDSIIFKLPFVFLSIFSRFSLPFLLHIEMKKVLKLVVISLKVLSIIQLCQMVWRSAYSSIYGSNDSTIYFFNGLTELCHNQF